jgi:hypothetical protein
MDYQLDGSITYLYIYICFITRNQKFCPRMGAVKSVSDMSG